MGAENNGVFLKVALSSRAVRLLGCPLGELPLYFRLPTKYNFEKEVEPGALPLSHLLFFNSTLKEKKISTTQENPLSCKTLKDLCCCLSLPFLSTPAE